MPPAKPPANCKTKFTRRYVPKYYVRLTITVKSGDRVYYVGGEVKGGRSRALRRRHHCHQSHQSAGGLTDFANHSKVWLIRANGQRIKVDYDKALENPPKTRRFIPATKSMWKNGFSDDSTQHSFGKKGGQPTVVRRFPFRIGRAPENDLQLDDDGVWDQHLALEFQSREASILRSRQAPRSPSTASRPKIKLSQRRHHHHRLRKIAILARRRPSARSAPPRKFLCGRSSAPSPPPKSR
jgi:hypothetical protein